MRLTCPSCGTRYGSADEPASGCVYSIWCRCGKRIMVAGAAAAARPASGPRHDPYAASQGLLIDEAEARALAAGSPVVEATVEAAPSDEVEVTVTFSKALAPPAAKKNDEKLPAPRKTAASPTPAVPPAAAVPPAWIVPAVAIIAFLAVGGGSAWFLLPHAGTTLTAALAALTRSLAGERSEAPPPVPSPRPGEPASPSAATTAALPGSDGTSPRRAAPVEPAPQRAAAEAPSPRRDRRTGVRTKLAARQRAVGQR